MYTYMRGHRKIIKKLLMFGQGHLFHSLLGEVLYINTINPFRNTRIEEKGKERSLTLQVLNWTSFSSYRTSLLFWRTSLLSTNVDILWSTWCHSRSWFNILCINLEFFRLATKFCIAYCFFVTLPNYKIKLSRFLVTSRNRGRRGNCSLPNVFFFF